MPPSSPPGLSIVIVTWNSAFYIRDCLKSLIAATSGYSTRIIVVDNASSDQTCHLIRSEFPRVKLIAETTNWGFGQGNNLGIAHAAGKYLLLLNPDTVVNSHAIDTMMNFLNSHPNVCAVGPEQMNDRNRFTLNFSKTRPVLFLIHFIESLLSLIIRQPKILFPYSFPVPMLNLGCVMFRFSDLPQPVFDSDLFMYGEEIDLFSRLKPAGKANYLLRNCYIYHYREKSVSLTNRKYQYALAGNLTSVIKLIARLGRK